MKGSSAESLIELKGIEKHYGSGSSKVEVLKNINLSVERGEFLAIMGPSGSGKSTLMNIIGLLDKPSSGKVFLGGKDITHKKDDELAKIRGKMIGFVFQSFNLYPTMSVLENIMLPMRIHEFGEGETAKKSADLIDSVGLSHRKKYFPNKLSGGEMQRVAIARALSTDPSIILADEPTGNLDSERGKEIMEIFKKLNGEGRTIILITHESGVAHYADRIVNIMDGRIGG